MGKSPIPSLIGDRGFLYYEKYIKNSIEMKQQRQVICAVKVFKQLYLSIDN